MKDGILVINKPAEWTSQDVCTKLRHRLHIKKIGHTGTLDPMATGVLPVCMGKATRIIEYYDRDMKTYHAGMQLGITSDTLDIWGTVSDERQDYSGVTEKMVLDAFASYTGTVKQIPPKYSALRINGKRAYDLARAGAEFEIKSREIQISSNEVTLFDIAAGRIEFDVTCSKGTYIRTICDDIGRQLGCGAVMTSLVRTASGYFKIDDASDLHELIELSDEEIENLVVPMDSTLEKLGIVRLDDNRFTAFINGNPSGTGFSVEKSSEFAENSSGKYSGCGVYRVYGSTGFIGTGILSGRNLIPDKVIFRG